MASKLIEDLKKLKELKELLDVKNLEDRAQQDNLSPKASKGSEESDEHQHAETFDKDAADKALKAYLAMLKALADGNKLAPSDLDSLGGDPAAVAGAVNDANDAAYAQYKAVSNAGKEEYRQAQDNYQKLCNDCDQKIAEASKNGDSAAMLEQVEIKQKAYEALNETLHKVESRSDAAHGVYMDTCDQNEKALNDYVSAKTSEKASSAGMTKMTALPAAPSPQANNANTPDEPKEDSPSP